MIPRTLIATLCVATGGLLIACCCFLVLNFMRLAEAENLVSDFVHGAVGDGQAFHLPALAALNASAQDEMARMLKRAHRIGPLIAIETSNCKAQAEPGNLCAGQLLACITQGTGLHGAFEAHVALCRNGDFDHYRLARSQWTFRFDDGEPIDPADRSAI